jgi:hypothetical protein
MKLGLAPALLFPVIAMAQSPPCASRMTALWSLGPTSLSSEETLPAALIQAGATRLWGVANISLQRDGNNVAVFSVRYPAGSINPASLAAPVGGAGFLLSRGAERAHACLSYEIRFPQGFQFALGGKLPGMYGGQAPAGGEAVAEGEGFSARFMWRRGGAGEIYLYQAGRTTPFGESIGRGAWFFHPGKWQRLNQEIMANSVGKQDGVIRAWLDGQLVVEHTGLNIRDRPDLGVAGLMFSTFFGGHDANWASPSDQAAEFRNITFYAD